LTRGQLLWIGTDRPFANIAVPVILLLLVMLFVWALMRYTVYGRSMYAIGSNPSAARLVGVLSKRFIFFGFVLSAAACGLSGIILTSQLGVGSGLFGVGMELSVVTAIVLGGASLNGGRGSIVGILVGLVIIGIIGILNNGLTLTGVNPFWQDVARGTLLIAAVSFDRLRARLSAR
jgi:ribose transport system permease protein